MCGLGCIATLLTRIRSLRAASLVIVIVTLLDWSRMIVWAMPVLVELLYSFIEQILRRLCTRREERRRSRRLSWSSSSYRSSMSIDGRFGYPLLVGRRGGRSRSSGSWRWSASILDPVGQRGSFGRGSSCAFDGLTLLSRRHPAATQETSGEERSDTNEELWLARRKED